MDTKSEPKSAGNDAGRTLRVVGRTVRKSIRKPTFPDLSADPPTNSHFDPYPPRPAQGDETARTLRLRFGNIPREIHELQ